MFKPAARLRTYENPTTPKPSQDAKILNWGQENAPVNTNSPYHNTSKAIKRCNAPINMKLQSDSLYHPAKNQQRHASENRTFFQQEWIDWWCEDDTNIHRYKTYLTKKPMSTNY